DLTVCVGGNDKTGNAIDDDVKPVFARSERGLGTFPLVNVCICSAPSDNLSRWVAQGAAPDEKPAKYSVVATKASIHLEWLLGRDRFLKCSQHAWQVVWMNRTLPAPLQRLLWREPCVVQPGLIEEIRTAIQSRRPRRRGDSIDEGTKLVF